MEFALIAMKLLTAATGLATALVKLYTQSTEQKRPVCDKEASDADPSEAHKQRRCPLAKPGFRWHSF